MPSIKIPEQQWLDSEGKGPSLPPGTQVAVPCMGEDFKGKVLFQSLHYDGPITFFGNVYVEGSDGKHYEFNGWQCKAQIAAISTSQIGD